MCHDFVIFEYPSILGYQKCLLGEGEHATLLLDGGNRCIQAVEVVTTWEDAMTVCNAGGGHLVHVYNSREHKKMKNWVIEVRQ